MPGPGGYKSLGVVWEEGHEIPVGFSKKVVGFPRITNNCAVCHTATYRLSENEVPHVVVAGPAHSNNLQSMLRFLFKAAHDPRFNSDLIMNEIRLVNANNYGNGRLSFIDREIYRFVLIPFTRKAPLKQEKQFTWMERYIEDGATAAIFTERICLKSEKEPIAGVLENFMTSGSLRWRTARSTAHRRA